ncbi:hypothetical protein [Amycolatopsis sp. cmx-4-61]|uniref:hypothetical protein n=1 Tax=Amycolatopsis sp. cmx-4-61 TaxID=2790937 RepID=UPI00397C32B8
MTGPKRSLESYEQEVYEDESGLHLLPGGEPVNEVVEYGSLTEFLRVSPAGASDPELLAALLRKAEWPAEAVWPELWTLTRQGVLSPDVVALVIGALWTSQPDLARVAVTGDPDGTGVRVVANFPAVWPGLARWAAADPVAASRIGRLIVLVVDAYPAAGQVLASMADLPPGLALVLGKSGLRGHPRAVEVLVAAAKTAAAEDVGAALTTWLTDDTGATELVGAVLASVPDLRKSTAILTVLASGLPHPTLCALWLAMWNHAPGVAVRALLLAGRSRPEWSAQALISAAAAGAPPESLVREVLTFDPEARAVAAAVVLTFATQPQRLAGMLGEPLDTTPQMAAAVTAATEAEPAAMAPTMAALLADRRTDAVTTILARIPPQQAATAFTSANWTPRAIVRLLPGLKATAPAAFAHLMSTLTPDSLAAVGRTLAQTAQWRRLAVFLDEVGPDAAALLFVSISAQAPAGGAAMLVEVQRNEPARSRPLLAHAFAAAPRAARDLCAWMTEHDDDATSALAAIATTDHDLAVQILTALTNHSPDGRLVRRLYASDIGILAPPVLQGLAATPRIYAHLITAFANADDIDLALALVIDLTPELAGAVLADALFHRRQPILDLFTAADAEFLADAATQVIEANPQCTGRLVDWLLDQHRADHDLLARVFSPATMVVAVPHLTPGHVKLVFSAPGSLLRDRLMDALVVATSGGRAINAARALEALTPDEVREALLAMPTDIARRILAKLQGPQFENDDFVVSLTNVKPQLLDAVLAELTWQSAANILTRLGPELRQAVPREAIVNLYSALRVTEQQQLLAALQSGGAQDIVEYITAPR